MTPQQRPIRKSLARSLLEAVLLSFGGLCLLGFLFQSHLIYHPQQTIQATPDQLGLAYEAATFRASDGVQLAAWWVPAPEPKAALLYCHGNGGNISHLLPHLEMFHRLGIQVLLFDYRGYGHSQGEPSEQGTYLDAEAAWRYLIEQRGVPANQILIFGQSLGGAIAAWLAARHTPAALILESAFTSLPAIGAVHYPYLPVRWLARFDYNTIGSLRQVRSPVLVIHSRQDEMIPFSHGQRLFEAAPDRKMFLEITGDHNSGFLTSVAAYEEGLRNFLTTHVLPIQSTPQSHRNRRR